MVMSKMKMKAKGEEFEEGEIISEEDGEFIPPQLLLETRRGNEKQRHDPCDADGSIGRKRQRFGYAVASETHVGEPSKANFNILNSMVVSKVKMKINFEQGEIITQQHFLEDGEFVPPQPLLQIRSAKRHDADASKGRKMQRVAETHLGAADIRGKQKQPHADGPRGRKRERFAHAHVGESSLEGPAADVRLTADCAKRQKICCGGNLGDSDEVTQLSKLLRATELKLKCAGVILKSQSAPDFPAAKLRHSCL